LSGNLESFIFVKKTTNTMNKNYESKPLGFDRTQLFKEAVQPIVDREAAMKTTLQFMSAHNLQWSMEDIMLVNKRVLQWFQTGDESWVTKMDTYFKLKRDQQLQELFKDLKNIEVF